MLYLAIPAHNEVATIGVLLWRLRTVLAEFPREYEVVVYDDASTDETADVAEQYVNAMPVTVLRGTKPVGYAGAIDALVRYVANATRYPRRDAMLLLQGDFTDPPGIVPEFARRFEGGADLVVGERTNVVDAPVPVRRLFSASRLALRPFVRVDGVRDLTSSMRLVRISVLRDLLRTTGDAPVCEGDSLTANADLLLRLVPHARRVETVPVEPTYGVRMRDTRRVTLRDALASLRWGWGARGRKVSPAVSAEPAEAGERGARDARRERGRDRNERDRNDRVRRDEPELTAERLRERLGDRSNGDRTEGEPRRGRDRDRKRPARESREKPETRNDVRSDVRSDARPKREPKEREPREKQRESKRDARSPVAPPPVSAPPLTIDDPFAPPPKRDDPFAALDRITMPRDGEGSAPSSDSRTRGAQSRADSPDARTDMPRDDASPDDGASDDGVDDGANADANVDANVDATRDDEASRERRRRRNRRSRRRGRGTREEGVAGDTAESEGEGSLTDEGGLHDRHGRGGPSEYGSDDDGSSDEGPRDDGSNDGASEGDDADEAAENGETPSRRRGRRGRRGGVRRSRRRRAEGSGEGAGEGAGESSHDSPPERSGDRPDDGGSRD